ncbi:MAG: type II toxin-antitoxin system HigB family toxin [Chloroflexi bacterium]|nr:type II toxin-antitoxin system HigB family toxin [Chloroflexota bacterium]
MHIVSLKLLRLFWEKHPDAEQPLRAWYLIAKRAQWRTPTDIKADYGTASMIDNNRVVFNIKGNDYRLVVLVAYRKGRLFIRFVGTHAEYDRIDAETI